MFSDTREQARPLMRQIHENRKALFAAVRAGNTSDIDHLTSAQAPLMAQLTAIQAKGFAKFYATLNADQKAKVDTMAGHTGALFMGGMAKHHS